jgi:hypothetical protein
VPIEPVRDLNGSAAEFTSLFQIRRSQAAYVPEMWWMLAAQFLVLVTLLIVVVVI